MQADERRSLISRALPAIVAAAWLAVAWPGSLAAAPVQAGGQQAAGAGAAGDSVRDGAALPGVPADLEELSALATAAVVLVEVEAGQKSRQGSGFIVDSDGLILTNHHVIRDATNARIRMASGDVYDRVSIMATDERRDIAVLKISGFGLPTLALGNSDSVRIGTDVIAIGSPMGLENTVSTGIVSGRRQEPRGFQLLQISAPASTGSSGGPVLSRDARVIGIAASQFRNGQNLNFAVPINYARGMLTALDSEPLAVLGSTGLDRRSAPEETEMSSAPTAGRVNAGLRFDLSGFEDHRLDLSVHEENGAIRHTTVTHRLIEDIAGGEPRIERYVEGRTTLQPDPSAAPETTRRERRRSIMSAVDLAPVSARGQIEWRINGEWFHTSYDLQFEDGRVTGTVEDSTGVVRQIDRDLPAGIVLRQMRDIAFGALVADPLVGRSMELQTFDASTAELRTDRFDIRRRTTIEVNGTPHEALAVDVATGLVNERAHYSTGVPRRLLRHEHAETGAVEEVVGFQLLPRAPED